MTRAEWEALVEYTLNIGRQMMECGAEAWRAENTMARIFRAYDLEVLDAHVIATQAAVTVKTPTGEHYTSTCMILPDKTGTDLGRLETLNAAARHICDAPPPLEELPLCLKRPVARWSWRELLGYLLGAGAFAIFFGGVFLDGVAAGAIGGVVYLMEQVRRVHQQNKIIYTVVACFLAGLLAQACVGIGFGVNLDLIMIGDIMLFIPGLVIVNGVREFFYADILTGLYRLVEALLIAGAIAAGYAVSLMMGEGAIQILCGGLGTLAYALFFHVRPRHLLLATLGGALSWLLYLLVLARDGNVFLSALVASMGVCLWSEGMARVRKAPANIFMIPGIIPLLPGGALYYTMSALIGGDMDTVMLKGKETGLMALGIVVGILVASELVRMILWAEIRRKKMLRSRRTPPGPR